MLELVSDLVKWAERALMVGETGLAFLLAFAMAWCAEKVWRGFRRK